jgi:hypothetical protein
MTTSDYTISHAGGASRPDHQAGGDTTAKRILDYLAAYNLKREGDGTYRSNSPLRAGSDSGAFSLKIEADGEHGAYFDHVSGDGGSLYALARLLKIETGGRPVEIPTTKRAYTGLADYALAHGLPADALIAAGWREVSHQRRPALEFPTATGVRYRFLDEPDPKNGRPAYKSAPGTAQCWYRLAEAVQIATQTGQPLTLCNGEISTLAGQYAGVAACALTSSGEKGHIPDQLLAELKAAWRGAIIVALDCDAKGRSAAAQLEAQLKAAGYAAKAIDLGFPATSGGDLADFCKLYGSSAPQALQERPALSASAPEEISPLRSRSVEELWNRPPLAWLIQKEIPAKALVVLYGPAGGGKTFIALDYGLQVSQHGTVIYVAAEDADGLLDRIAAWRNHHKLDIKNLRIVDAALPLLEAPKIDEFIRENLAFNPILVIIDTLAQCMIGGDENSAKDMGIVMAHCAQIRKATGATVMLVHHTGKNATNGERGSSALRGAADTMIELENLDGENIRLACDKMRNAPPFPSKHLRKIMQPARDDRESCVWLPRDLVADVKSTLTETENDILEALNLPLYRDEGMAHSALLKVTGQPDRTFRRALSRLAEFGFIEKRGGKRGDYCITEAGRAALGGQPLSTLPLSTLPLPTPPQSAAAQPPAPPRPAPRARRKRMTLEEVAAIRAAEIAAAKPISPDELSALLADDPALLQQALRYVRGEPFSRDEFERLMGPIINRGKGLLDRMNKSREAAKPAPPPPPNDNLPPLEIVTVTGKVFAPPPSPSAPPAPNGKKPLI